MAAAVSCNWWRPVCDACGWVLTGCICYDRVVPAAVSKGKSSPPSMKELCRGEAQLTCAVGNVVISTSGKTPDPGYLQLAVRSIDDYSRGFPWGLGWIVLIAENEPPPDENGRRGIINMRNALRSCVRASVMVVEGQGFAASAKRSIIAMFSLASTQPYPTKVAGSVLEGAEKLAQMLGHRLDPTLHPQAIADVTAAVRAAAPKL